MSLRSAPTHPATLLVACLLVVILAVSNYPRGVSAAPSASDSGTPTATASPSPTQTRTPTATATRTPTPTTTTTSTVSASATHTPIVSATSTSTPTPSPSPTAASTAAQTATSTTGTATQTPAPTATSTVSAQVSTTVTATPTGTSTSTPTATLTASATSTSAPTQTPSPTPTSTPTQTPSPTATSMVLAQVSDVFPGIGTLSIPGSASGSTSNATTESGEPQPSCAPIGKTVWYRVVPGEAGVLTASAGGSSFDTVLAIYTGSSLNALVERACNDDEDYFEGVLTSRLEVVVSAGETYYLQLGGYDGDSGNFQLQVSLDTSRTSLPEPTATRTPTPLPTLGPSLTPTPTPIGGATPLATVQTAGTPGRTQTTGAPGVAGVVPLAAQGPSGAAGAAVTVSSFEPSLTRFLLPNGQIFGVSLDLLDLDALRSLHPNVANVRISLDAAPRVTDEVQAGSLGGGVVTPFTSPVRLKLELLDRAGNVVRPPGTPTATPVAFSEQSIGDPAPNAQLAIRDTSPTAFGMPVTGLADVSVNLSLPVMTQPPQPDRVFAWLYAIYQRGDFLGYVRPPASFDPTTSSLRTRLSLADIQASSEGTLFLPAVLQPAWVGSFDPGVHIYSGPTDDAIDYGLAGPQNTTFLVVAPQVGNRLFVYNSATNNYGWIDVRGVGPVPSPAGS
jgi:hypothetical protein